jgi:hypothetical protein
MDRTRAPRSTDERTRAPHSRRRGSVLRSDEHATVLAGGTPCQGPHGRGGGKNGSLFYRAGWLLSAVAKILDLHACAQSTSVEPAPTARVSRQRCHRHAPPREMAPRCRYPGATGRMSAEVRECPWTSLYVRGSPCTSVEVPGCPCTSADARARPCTSLHVREYPGVSVHFSARPCVCWVRQFGCNLHWIPQLSDTKGSYRMQRGQKDCCLILAPH